jgi:hypothetical protein
MKKRALVASLLLVALCVIVSPVLMHSNAGGGCPPNDTCRPGTSPRACECWASACDTWEAEGYCILCVQN